MIKVKTFTSPLKIFHAKLEKLILRKASTQRIDGVKGGFHGSNYH